MATNSWMVRRPLVARTESGLFASLSSSATLQREPPRPLGLAIVKSGSPTLTVYRGREIVIKDGANWGGVCTWKIMIAFLSSAGQMEAWLKHLKKQREHRTQRS